MSSPYVSVFFQSTPEHVSWFRPNGNLTRWNSPEHGVQNYSYDIENRLKSVAVNGIPLATHFYDYDGLGVGGLHEFYIVFLAFLSCCVYFLCILNVLNI